jgi:hypothetical protein
VENHGEGGVDVSFRGGLRGAYNKHGKERLKGETYVSGNFEWSVELLSRMDPRIGGMGFLAKDIRDKKHEIFVVRVRNFVEEDGTASWSGSSSRRCSK